MAFVLIQEMNKQKLQFQHLINKMNSPCQIQYYILQCLISQEIIKLKERILKSQSSMKRKYAGVILILMMLGHNYVINQPQSLQKDIQQTHKVTVTEFNLLYSIPSVLAILTIIPVGILYHKYPNFTLMFGISVLLIGQLLASMFGAQGKEHYFSIFIGGRTLEASGAEILYMIQGNLASSWMGNLAGFVFILPEVGQIMNAFFTPYAAIHWGVSTSLWIGVVFCSISFVACWYLYCHLKKIEKFKKDKNLSKQIEMMDTSTQKTQNYEIEPNFPNQIQDNKPSKKQRSKDKENSESKSSQEIKSTQQHKTSDEEFKLNGKDKLPQPESILKAGKIFWLTILICAINECLYFPFLDNANQLIQTRFKIPYSETGYFLCLPFFAAIFTTIVMSKVLFYFEKRKLIFYTSILPFLGHVMIMLLPNCEQESLSIGGRLLLGAGFFVFGTGIGAYYSISFPAVGMAVPSKIRGLSYGVLCFFQTLAMSMVPILSGIIIEEDISNEIQGYRNSSFMFVVLTLFGVFIAFLIKKLSNENSYAYDDQEQLIEQQEQFQASNQKVSVKGQNKTYISIQIEKTINDSR